MEMIVAKKIRFIYGDERAKVKSIYKYSRTGNLSSESTFACPPMGVAGFLSVHVGLICAFLREGPFKGFSLF